MDKAIQELKIRAKRLLKKSKITPHALQPYEAIYQRQQWSPSLPLKLKDCQNLLALQCGFDHWQHAQAVLSGNLDISLQPDFGQLWHHRGCDALINLWYADYLQATLALKREKDRYLVPYKNQFVVVRFEFLELLGVTREHLGYLNAIDRDLLAGYGTPSWDIMTTAIIEKKTRSQ